MKYAENSHARKVLRFLKKIWVLNFLRRIYKAGKVPNKQYQQILKWGVQSREDTNYTYHLTSINMGYLADFIAVVTHTERKAILDYMNEAKEDTGLRQTILEAIDQSPFKNIADREVRFGRRLGWYAFVRIMKPKVVVETGVDKGLGAILLCSALLRNEKEGAAGKYYGTDINPDAGYMLIGKYKNTGEILYGDSIESLSNLQKPIDLFINDSDHSVEYEYKEYKTIQDRMSDKTIILGDNSHQSDKLERFSIETGRKFLYFREEPLNHWHPGGGIGISYL